VCSRGEDRLRRLTEEFHEDVVVDDFDADIPVESSSDETTYSNN